MQTVEAIEAKTHLAALLDRVAKGEQFTITRHGIPAALLVPITEKAPALSHREIIQGMRDLRRRVKPDNMSVKDMATSVCPSSAC